MIFKPLEIKIKNFLSIGEEVCHIELDKVQSTLIVGDNGAGKTTILEALTFVLFNKTYRKLSQSDIVNSFTGKECLVWLKFSIGNDIYEVERGLKPNIFTVKKNGNKLEDLVGSANQKRFERILGINFNIYKQLIVLGTSGYDEFMSLTTSERRNLLEKILKLDVISKMDEENKGVVKNLQLKVDNINFKLGTLEAQMETVNKTLEGIESYIQERNERIESLENKKRSVVENKAITEEKISTQRSVLESMKLPPEPKFKPLVVMDKATLDKVKELRKTIEEKRNPINEAISKFKYEINMLDKDIETFTTVVDRYNKGGHCPSCMQELSSDDDLVLDIKSKIEEKQSIMKETQDKISKYEEALEKIRLYELKVEAQKKQKEEEIANKNKEIENENKLIQEEYYKDKFAYQEEQNKLNNLINELSKYEGDIESIDSHIRDIKTDIEDKKNTKVHDVSSEITKLTEEREQCLIEIYRRSIITNLLKDNGIRSDMIDRYIPLFNQSIQKYLNLLGADYAFTVDSNFKETILSRGRENFKYTSFSRGEQARIDLAILFSWRDIIEKIYGQELSVLFLDEVFDSSTDTSGVDGIKRVLNSLHNVNVFSISHKEHNPEDFDSVITVKKVGRFSKYSRTFV